MSQGAYCFPILDPKDIIEYLRGEILDMDVSMNDFKEPQKDRWQKLFTQLLCDCCLGLSPDKLHEMPVNNNFSFPELFEKSKPLFNLFKCMQALLITCGVEDFRMSDIIDPKPKRLVRICSAIMNFRRFQEERLKIYRDLQFENEAIQNQREHLLFENEELMRKINTIKAVRAEKEPEIQALQEQINEKSHHLESLHDRVAVIKTETNESKTAVAEKKLAVSRMKEQLVALKHEDANLSRQIVASPDRVRGEQQRMEHQLGMLRQSKEESQGRLRDLNARRHLQQQWEQQCERARKLVESFKEQEEEKRLVQLALSGQREEANAKREEIKSIDAKKVQLKLQMSILQEKLEKCRLIYRDRLNEMKNTYDLLKQEKENVLASCTENENARDLMLGEKLKLQQDEARELQQHMERMNDMRNDHAQLLVKLDSYHINLGKSCEQLLNSVDPTASK